MLNIQLALPDPSAPRTKRVEATIDSGATKCLFHADFARHLGIDLKACPVQQTFGIGGPEDIYVHDVLLYIPGGPVQIRAGFMESLPVAGLLGMTGFFEHFRITFDGGGQFCDLERIYKA